jgi:hypothetical protein
MTVWRTIGDTDGHHDLQHFRAVNDKRQLAPALAKG